MIRLFFSIFITLFFSCSNKDYSSLKIISGKAQGTYYHIKYLSNQNIISKQKIDSIFLEIDSSLSIYKNYSLISKLNSGKEVVTDSLFNIVFNASARVFNETNGYFDCTVGPLVRKWGFYKNNFDLVEIDSVIIKDLLSYVGFQKIILRNDSLFMPRHMRLDFNSIAQGFTVDIIANNLISNGVKNFMIEVGGEIMAKGLNADNEIWRIGIEKPSNSITNKQFQFILSLNNKAMATSGNYRKYFIKDGLKYSHTINPFTGFPAKNKLLSVTTIYENCIMADAYATAFMTMGLNRTKEFLKSNKKIEVCLIYTDKDGNLETFISQSLTNYIN